MQIVRDRCRLPADSIYHNIYDADLKTSTVALTIPSTPRFSVQGSFCTVTLVDKRHRDWLQTSITPT
jgi:hypothetical protein